MLVFSFLLWRWILPVHSPHIDGCRYDSIYYDTPWGYYNDGECV